MARPKDQGTKFETWIVNRLRNIGLTTSNRLAEGGMHDRGDVRTVDEYGWEWIIEAKSRERLNVTRELAKARKKGGLHTVLYWKRLVKTGKKKRQPDGEAVIVVMAVDTFEELLTRK